MVILTENTIEQLIRPLLGWIDKLDGTRLTLEKIMSKLETLNAGLDEINAKVTKIGSETTQALTEIAELKELLADQDIPQEVLDKVDLIKGRLDAVDALVPDAAPPAEPVNPPADPVDPVDPVE